VLLHGLLVGFHKCNEPYYTVDVEDCIPVFVLPVISTHVR
jgi:hypothetical protein